MPTISTTNLQKRLIDSLGGMAKVIEAAQVSSNETSEIKEIPLDLITSNPYQIREVQLDEVAELANDIYVNGLLQIPIGRAMPDGTLQQAFGHRRKLAHDFIVARGQNGDETFANWQSFTTMKMIIRPLTDMEMYSYMAAENGQRENPNIMEIARSIQLGKEMFKLTQHAAGRAHGVNSDGQIVDILSLLTLPVYVQGLIERGAFGTGKGAGQGKGRQLVRLVKEGFDEQTIIKVAELAAKQDLPVKALQLMVDNEIKQRDDKEKRFVDVAIARAEAKAVIGGGSSGGSSSSGGSGSGGSSSSGASSYQQTAFVPPPVVTPTAEVSVAPPAAEPVAEVPPMEVFPTSMVEVPAAEPFPPAPAAPMQKPEPTPAPPASDFVDLVDQLQAKVEAVLYPAELPEGQEANEVAVLAVLRRLQVKSTLEAKIRQAIGTELPPDMRNRMVRKLLSVL